MGMNRRNLFTSNSKEYIIFFIKLLLMLAIVLFIIFRFIPSYTGSFVASLIDKVDRLESISGPKIVLIGNSNLAYGIDSELIEKEIGLPVVNMGLHGALGNAFHEEMAKLNVCKGDIYVVCHTDYCDMNIIENNTLAWLTIENHPRLWRILRAEDIPPLVNDFPIYLKKCIEREFAGTRNQEEGRSLFNEYGDRCEVRDKTEDGIFYEGALYIPYVGDATMERLNELNKYLTERGATLVIAGYPIADGEYTPDIEMVINMQNVLKEKADFPVVSDFTDYMYDYKFFYNSTLHLNDEGTVLRTEQLIEDLERYFQEVK